MIVVPSRTRVIRERCVKPFDFYLIEIRRTKTFRGNERSEVPRWNLIAASLIHLDVNNLANTDDLRPVSKQFCGVTNLSFGSSNSIIGVRVCVDVWSETSLGIFKSCFPKQRSGTFSSMLVKDF